MIKNMGQTDRLIRYVAGFIYLALWFLGAVVPGTLAFTVGVVSIYVVVTAALGHDPIYRVLDFSTREEEVAPEENE